jgi:hypothetical protein
MVRRLSLCLALVGASAFVTDCNPPTPIDVLLIGGPTDLSVRAGDRFAISMTAVGAVDPTATTNGVVTVTDRLPAGFHFVSAGANTPGWQCTAEQEVVTCLTFAPISRNVGKPLDLSLETDASLAGAFSNVPQIAYGGDTNLQDNTITYSITVAGLPRVTQDLDFQKAKNAGAQFTVDIRRNEQCRQIGVGDWLDDTWGRGQWTNGRHPGVVFGVDCGTRQGEAFVDAFANFRLRNGWVVKAVRKDDWIIGDARFDLDAGPATGSCAPLIKAHIRSYGISTRGDLRSPTASLRVAFQITIEGPDGTDPYSGGVAAACAG